VQYIPEDNCELHTRRRENLKSHIVNLYSTTLCCIRRSESLRIKKEKKVRQFFTRQYIPEDNCELHTRRRKNLKSHMYISCTLLFVNYKDLMTQDYVAILSLNHYTYD
jgi:hypothetical protein